MRWRIILITLVAVLSAACTEESACDDTGGPLLMEVDAAALAQSGSRLEVCIDDLCNAEEPPSSYVSIGSSGMRDRSLTWTVQRVTGSSWESLASGTVDTACSSAPTMVRVELDANARAIVSITP